MMYGIEQLWQSIALLRWVGYGLLMLLGLDFGDKLIPPGFMNPAWEFQTVGSLVEQVPLLLLGLVLVFLCDPEKLGRLELITLKIISWLTLLFAIVYFLLIPLGVTSVVRLDNQNQRQLIGQANQQQEVIQQAKTALTQVKTAPEFAQYLRRLSSIGIMPQITNGESWEVVRDRVAQTIDQTQKRLDQQTKTTRTRQQMGLFKTLVKWNLGALVGGFLLLMIWRSTRWIRRMPLVSD